MIAPYFLAILLAISSFVSHISAQVKTVDPFIKPGYKLNYKVSKAGRLWQFDVFSDGYLKDGQKAAVDTLQVDKTSKSLIVIKAANGDDKTDPRLKMRHVLAQCWTMAGLQASDLKEVVAKAVENEDMSVAIEECRTEMKLSWNGEFLLSGNENDAARKACWYRLRETIFAKAIRGAIVDFNIQKQVTKIGIEKRAYYRDDVYYKFA